MEEIKNLKDFLNLQVMLIYGGEKHFDAMISEMLEKAEANDVKKFLMRQADEKRRQRSRLGEIFNIWGMKPKGEYNKSIHFLGNQMNDIQMLSKSKKLSDSILITFNKAMTALMINAYQTAVSSAIELENTEVSNLLRRCLREEKGIEKQLSVLEEEHMEELLSVTSIE